MDEQSSMGFSLRQRGCNVYSHGSSIEPPVSSCAQAQDTEVRPSLGTNVRPRHIVSSDGVYYWILHLSALFCPFHAAPTVSCHRSALYPFLPSRKLGN